MGGGEDFVAEGDGADEIDVEADLAAIAMQQSEEMTVYI
jgi:hypothetical protein